MSGGRFFQPAPRLKALLAEPGGMRVSDALRRADRAVLEIRGRCLSGIDQKVEEILAASRSDAPSAMDRCYRLSNEIYAEAGVFGLVELSGVAHSLCTLLAESELDRIPREVIAVHVDALRALRSPAVAENRQLRTAVVAELRALTARITAPRAGPTR